jgi:hypothetical protein
MTIDADIVVGLMLLRGMAAAGELDNAYAVAPGSPPKPFRDWTVSDVRQAWPPLLAHHVSAAMVRYGLRRLGDIERGIDLVSLEDLLFPTPDSIDVDAAREVLQNLVDRWGHDRIMEMLCELADLDELERGTRDS